MARAKFTPQPETTPADTGETDDWTQFFAGESQQIVVNVKRIEPAMHQGLQVGGHLAQLTLTPDEAQQLPNVLIQKWGGGLYGIQWCRRKESGGYSFDKSFRIRCAGMPKLESVATPAPAPVPAPQPAQLWHQQIPQNAYPWPQPAPQASPNALLQELPRLLGQVVEIARGGQGSANGQALDTVALVQALQSAVRPEDDFSKFERFASLMNKLVPKAPTTAVEAVAQIDWVSLAGAAGEFMRNMRPQPPGAPPSAQSARVQPVAPIEGPPGWHFDGQRWVENEEEETEEEDETEEEEEQAEESRQRKPMTMEELGIEFQRMAPEEQAKVAQLAAQFANLNG